MYTAYFGLREQPFDIIPDPRFIYANPGHKDAYAALQYGIDQRKGILLLIGEPGTGKTTLLRRLVKNLGPKIHVASLDFTMLTFEELFDCVCQDLALPIENKWRLLEKIQALEKILYAWRQEGETAVILIDEAQDLDDQALEKLRLLSNLEAENEKLVQIVVAGQPELEKRLKQPGPSQFKQRIVVTARLDRLQDQEVGPFIQYRLSVAGCQRHDVFSPEAVQRITWYADGIPRLINSICDNALLCAYSFDQQTVSAEIIEQVAQDLFLEKREAQETRGEEDRREETALAPLVPERRLAEEKDDSREISLNSVSPPPTERPQFFTSEDAGYGSRRLVWLGIGSLFGILIGGVFFSFPIGEFFANRGVIASAPPPKNEAGISPVVTLPSPQAAVETTEEHRKVVPDLAKLSVSNRPQERSPDEQSEQSKQSEPNTPDIPNTLEGVSSIKEQDEADEPDTPDTSNTLEGVSGIKEPDEQNEPDQTKKGQFITIANGETISERIYALYGSDHTLALTLVKDLNPHIKDMDRVAAGVLVWGPSLTRETLLRKLPDGVYHLLVAAFFSKAEAQKLVQTARQEGYALTITPQQISGTLLLHRVELRGLQDPATIDRTWDWVNTHRAVSESSPSDPLPQG